MERGMDMVSVPLWLVVACVAVIGVLVYLVLSKHRKKKRESPSVAQLRAVGEALGTSGELFLRERDAIIADAERAGNAYGTHYDQLQDAHRNFVHEVLAGQNSNILKHPGYTPPIKKNGEDRKESVHETNSDV